MYLRLKHDIQDWIARARATNVAELASYQQARLSETQSPQQDTETQHIPGLDDLDYAIQMSLYEDASKDQLQPPHQNVEASVGSDYRNSTSQLGRSNLSRRPASSNPRTLWSPRIGVYGAISHAIRSTAEFLELCEEVAKPGTSRIRWTCVHIL